jgi:hypothetical protein
MVVEAGELSSTTGIRIAIRADRSNGFTGGTTSFLTETGQASMCLAMTNRFAEMTDDHT